MKRNRSRNVKKSNQFLEMAGHSAIALINEEVETALGTVNWDELIEANLDTWFEDTVRTYSGLYSRYRIQNVRRVLSYTASILMLLVTVAVIVFAAVKPARALLFRFIVERFPQYSEYFIKDDNEDTDSDETFTEPSYIPEGFQLENSINTDEARFYDWMNEETGHFITFSQTKGESSIMLDTEGAQIEQMMINGHSVEVIVKGELTTMQFFSDTFCYALITDLTYDECVKIVESIP